MVLECIIGLVFFFQAEDGIRDRDVTGVQTCALPISGRRRTGTAGPAGLLLRLRHAPGNRPAQQALPVLLHALAVPTGDGSGPARCEHCGRAAGPGGAGGTAACAAATTPTPAMPGCGQAGNAACPCSQYSITCVKIAG